MGEGAGNVSAEGRCECGDGMALVVVTGEPVAREMGASGVKERLCRLWWPALWGLCARLVCVECVREEERLGRSSAAEKLGRALAGSRDAVIALGRGDVRRSERDTDGVDEGEGDAATPGDPAADAAVAPGGEASGWCGVMLSGCSGEGVSSTTAFAGEPCTDGVLVGALLLLVLAPLEDEARFGVRGGVAAVLALARARGVTNVAETGVTGSAMLESGLASAMGDSTVCRPSGCSCGGGGEAAAWPTGSGCGSK